MNNGELIRDCGDATFWYMEAEKYIRSNKKIALISVQKKTVGNNAGKQEKEEYVTLPKCLPRLQRRPTGPKQMSEMALVLPP